MPLRMSQGRGKHSHYVPSGSGSKHFNVSPNSLEAGGSNMKQPECLDASHLVRGDDDLHSLSACSDSKETHQDMNRFQIGETLKKEADDGATLKPDFSGKVKVGYMLEESPLPAKADTEDQAAFQEKGEKNSEGVGHLHLDICPPKIGAPVMLKPSLLVKNRQKRNEIKHSMEGKNRTQFRSGMVLLKNDLSLSDQVKIIKACQDHGLDPGGFYQPGYCDGAILHLKMMCLGKSWVKQIKVKAEKALIKIYPLCPFQLEILRNFYMVIIVMWTRRRRLNWNQEMS